MSKFGIINIPEGFGKSGYAAKRPRKRNEEITGVAVCRDGEVWAQEAPMRHAPLIRWLAEMGIATKERPITQDEQGFVTSTGRFVTRWQAARIAYHAWQTSKLIKRASGLISEDLW